VAAGTFAKEVTALAGPGSVGRAKAFLFASSRLGAFAESVGLELSAEVVFTPSVIERCCHPAVTAMSAATRRTLRSNLVAIARGLFPGPPAVPLGRERAKAPYSRAEIACYLALADAQPTARRRHRLSALVCLGAGAGLVGGDLRGVRGTDVVSRSGGVVVAVRGRRPRTVPVRAWCAPRLVEVAGAGGTSILVGGADVHRRNVTAPLTSSLSGGADLPRIELGRLRATWLCDVAGAIGLRAFMDAAGITCSQRLGDLVAGLDAVCEEEAVALLGGGR
jgi:integrase